MRVGGGGVLGLISMGWGDAGSGQLKPSNPEGCLSLAAALPKERNAVMRQAPWYGELRVRPAHHVNPPNSHL